MSQIFDEDTKEQLIADFKVVVADAEALLKATANHGGEELAAIRAKAEESLKEVKEKLATAQASLVSSTKDAARATEVYVQENPWAAVGIAAGIGLLVGLLNGRSSSN